MIKTTKNIAIGLGILTLAFAFANKVEAKFLSIGSTGSEVVKLQTFLISNGFPIPLIESGVASKGYFGEQTLNAVNMYQESKKLLSTGGIDSETYANSLALGAVSGPYFYSDFLNINGIKENYSSDGANAWASTTCSYRVTATTTLVLASFSATQLASSTMVEIGVGASAFATTTSLGIATLPTGGGALVASTSSAFNRSLFPGDYVNVKVGMNGISGSLPKIAGVCKVVTRDISNPS